MTNKFRRSVTSVLLAASLLFSSQSVIAFADYGSKSDTSDLSPVQESVEPVIGESQAMMAAPMNMEPNSKFPGYIKEIFINVTIDQNNHFYGTISRDQLPGYNEHDFDEKGEFGCDDVDVNSKNGTIEVTGEWEESRNHYFYLEYEADFWDLDWDDKDVLVKVVLNPTNDPSDDVEDPNSNNSWKDQISVNLSCDTDQTHQYTYKLSEGKYTVDWTEGSEEATVSITDEQGQEWVDKYDNSHTYDSCEPTTITLKWDDGSKDSKWHCGGGSDEQGHWDVVDANTFNITMHCEQKPSKPTIDNLGINVKIECISNPEHYYNYPLMYGTEGYNYKINYTENEPTATVTIIASTYISKYNSMAETTHDAVTIEDPVVNLSWTKENGWQIASEKEKNVLIQVSCDEPQDPSVPLPTDPEIEELLKNKINVMCYTVTAHGEKTYGAEIEGGYTRGALHANVVEGQPTTYTYDLTINYNPYVAQYNNDNASAKHGLVDTTVTNCSVVLKWVPEKDGIKAHWELEKTDDPLVTIPVQCEYPTLDQDDLANLWVNFFCINDETHNKDHWTNLASCTAEIDYHIEYDKDGFAEVTLLNPEQFAKTYCDSTLKVPHLYVGYEPESLELHWNGENWVSYEISRSSDANSFTIGILCGPSIARINELLNAQIICVNDDAKHQKTASFDNLLDYSFDVTNLKNDNSVVTAEVVVKPSLYLDKFYNISGGIEHSIVVDNETYPVNEDGSVTVRFSYTGGEWNLLYPTRNMVTFPVKCTTQKPIDNPDWEDISALFNDYVTVDCTTGGHNPISYSLVESEVQIGNVYSAAPIVGEESTTYFVPITFNTPDNIRNRVISAYDNSTPNTHSYQSGSIPASITLRYDNENKVWVNEDVKNVLFTVTCTTGGGTIDPNPNPGGGGDNDDDDDRYTGGNTVTRTINDDDVPLNDRPNNTTTIDDEDVPLADLPDDTVTIDDGEVPLKDNPSTGDSLPFAAMAAAALSLGGVIVLNRKKK